MTMNPKTILSMAIAALAVTAMITAPAMAESQKHSKKSDAHTSAEAAGIDGMPKTVSSSAGHHEHKAGPAWRTIGGTVKQIKGDGYTVEDYEGNQVQLFVGQETKQLRQKRVGDTVRAEITRSGFANSIQ